MNRPSPTTANHALAKPQVEHLPFLAKRRCGQECRIHRSKPAWFCLGDPARVSPRASRDQTWSVFSAPGDALRTPAAEPAHLLRLSRYPRPHPHFSKNRSRSTCGFVFELFGAIRDSQSNVVDGPVSCRTPSRLRTKAPPRRREMPPWRLGVGWGLRFGLPPAARGPLAPGAVVVPSAYGYPRPGLRRRPWR